MRDERINVCYGISDKTGKYVKVMGTSICSMLENTESPVTVHIFHDETLNDENREKIKKITRKYRQNVEFYDVSKKCKVLWEELQEAVSVYGEFRFTIGAFYRLLVGEMLEGKNRAIYLDADTLVNMDIKELWERETAIGGLAAVSDIVMQNVKTGIMEKGVVAQEDYFNSGVLLIDLDKFRSIDNIMGKMVNFITKYLPEAPDQDFLNYCFPHSAILPEKFNCFVWRGKEEGGPRQDRIYHYVNHAIGLNMEDDFNRLYFKYFVKTPWCDENFIGNLAKKIEEVNYEYLNFANICAGKRRIAIGLANAREVISDMVHLNGDDMYIPFEDMDNVRLDYSRDKEIFVIFLNGGDYAIVRERLIDFGLTEGIHYFDMFSILGITNTTNRTGYKLFIEC